MHFKLGVFAGAVGGWMLHKNGVPTDTACLFASAAILGSLFPDSDAPTSTIGDLITPASAMIKSMVGHRGLLHTPIFYVGMYLALKYTGYLSIPALGFFLGVVIHLTQDLLTKGGIMILYPFINYRFCLLPVPSGHRLNTYCTLGLAYLVWRVMPYLAEGAINICLTS